MKDQLIDFETAKLAKEKGFDEECFHFLPNEYGVDKNLILTDFNKKHFEICKNSLMIKNAIALPTQSLLQRWLREKHKIDIIITSNLLGYGYMLYHRYPSKNITNSKSFETYEEALEVGLQEALKLI